MCGVGTAPNCVYGPDGKGSQSHPNEDGHLRFRWEAKNKCKNTPQLGADDWKCFWAVTARGPEVHSSVLNSFPWIMDALCEIVNGNGVRFLCTALSHNHSCVVNLKLILQLKINSVCFPHQSEARTAVSCMGFSMVMTAAEWPVLPPSVWQLSYY